MEIKIVKKEELEASLAKHNPGKFILFVNKYFPIKFKNGKYPIGTFSAIIGFIIATVGMITFDQMGDKKNATLFCLLYIPIAIHVFLNIISFKLNQWRIERICQELILTHEEYNINMDLYKL